jgi:hypothetical protein
MKQLKEKVKELAKTLSPRSYDILKRRFGLEDGNIATLQSIGNKYKITRERIRQIEAASLKAIRTPKAFAFLKNEIKLIADYINEHGNVVAEHFIVSELGKKGAHEGALLFLLKLIPEIKHNQGSNEFHPHWFNQKDRLTLMNEVNRHVKDELSRSRLIKTLEEIIHILKDKNLHLDQNHIISYLEVSRHIKKNHFGHYGLKHWPEVTPRGVKDKSYLVLRHFKKPLHFTEVAKAIFDLGLSGQPAHIQTVHNELIKDDRFVLVGRGIYGLKEWGYESGTVKDIIINVLKSAKHPLTKDEIVREVLKQRLVKPNTVILNLQNGALFKKTNDGKFTL